MRRVAATHTAKVALADPDPDIDTLRTVCQDALELGEHQQRLIQALLTLATSERGVEQWRPFDLAHITETVVTGRRYEAERRGINIESTLMAAPATGDAKLMELLVLNLIDNALRHNVRGGRIEVATNSTPGRATITVSNTGPTIPTSEIDQLF